jgi:hypothetical protein
MWERRDAYRVLVGRREGKNHLKGVDRRIILKWIFRKLGGVLWTNLGEGRDSWLAVVNAVMNLQVP